MQLTINDLALDRGGWRLFDNLSFTAPPGAHVALTGPNGAGKTSLLRAIAGFLSPSAGTIELSDREPSGSHTVAGPEARGPEDLHFLGHRDGLKAQLDARAHLRFWGDLLGGDGSDAVLEQVGLTRVADLPARTLSAGQGRRLALARLIAAPRPLWLLDEPAASLDTAGKALLTDMIAAHCGGGGIVIAAVHEPLGAPTQTVRLG